MDNRVSVDMKISVGSTLPPAQRPQMSMAIEELYIYKESFNYIFKKQVWEMMTVISSDLLVCRYCK
jgi:hypothetical protein